MNTDGWIDPGLELSSEACHAYQDDGYVILGRVLSDAGAWVSLWHRAREQLAAGALPSFQRWPEGNPDCA